MKKFYLLIMLLVITTCLFGCGSNSESESKGIHAPNESASYVGRDWYTAYSDFKNAGFSNITTEEIKDIDANSTLTDGCVETISINEESEYKLDSEYDKEAKVVIKYHTLVEYTAKIHVNFVENFLLYTYDVDFSVNGVYEKTLKHGEDMDYELSLSMGEHTISFDNDEDSKIKNEVVLNVTSDLEASYTISCESDDITIETDFVDYKVEVPEGQVKMTKSTDDFLGVNYENVVSDLKEMGFSNIKTEALYDIVFGITDDGSVESVTIDGKDTVNKYEIVSSDAEIIVAYHTLEDNNPDAVEEDRIEEDTDEEDSEEDTLEEEENNPEDIEEEEEEEETLLAYILDFEEYNVYYLIDLENKIAKYGTSYDTSALVGVFTEGDNLNDGIDVTFCQGTDSEYTERVHWHYWNSDSALITITSRGFQTKWLKTDVDFLPDYFFE